jgi:nucleotide-binding universal stress UspA family protein
LHVVEDHRWLRVARVFNGYVEQMEIITSEEFKYAGVSRRVDRGKPAERILDYVRENHIDLVAMPVRSSSGFRTNPLGHVVEELIREAPCPLWLHWETNAGGKGAGIRAKRICCAIHPDQSGELALRGAADLAQKIGAALTILCAVAFDGDPLQVESRLEDLHQRIAPGAQVRIAQGAIPTVVKAVLREIEAGLLITNGSREIILAADSVCPVLRVAARARRREDCERTSWYTVTAGRVA